MEATLLRANEATMQSCKYAFFISSAAWYPHVLHEAEPHVSHIAPIYNIFPLLGLIWVHHAARIYHGYLLLAGWLRAFTSFSNQV